MAETRLNLEHEVQGLFSHIDNGHNFLLSGGAGSGKTYSLIQTIKQITRENQNCKIACITYTNAAVREIESRVDASNLSVSTIHEFLWSKINQFQKELKISLIELINDEEITEIKSQEEVGLDYYSDKKIQYKEYTSISAGIISHDELLFLANHMYKKYPRLCDILKDKYEFILVDEYQDTSPLVVEILLHHLMQSKRNIIIGFFGDAMQSIYDKTIQNLNGFVDTGEVKEVKKIQNRRNPRLVYELANKLRTDGIMQEASNDNHAPNMSNGTIIEGQIQFYYSKEEEKLSALKDTLDWDYTDSKETKILNLTQNLIAPQAGFSNLMSIYDGDKILDYKKRIAKYIKSNDIDDDFTSKSFGEVIDHLLIGKTTESARRPIKPTPAMTKFIEENNELFELAKSIAYDEFKTLHVDKDSLLDDKKDDVDDISKTGSKRDNLIKHLFKIQTNINLYTEGKYHQFTKKTEFSINTIENKKELRKIILKLQTMSNCTIDEVIEYAHKTGICIKDDKLLAFIEKKQYVYNQVIKLKFIEFQDLYNYLEGYSPFSTQHKIKGTEFKNVLVIMDNGKWSNYNFEYLMNPNIESSLTTAKKSTFPTILDRTQKLFYVCCTRAMENLAVYYHNPSSECVLTAENWFGKDNVHEI